MQQPQAKASVSPAGAATTAGRPMREPAVARRRRLLPRKRRSERRVDIRIRPLAGTEVTVLPACSRGSGSPTPSTDYRGAAPVSRCGRGRVCTVRIELADWGNSIECRGPIRGPILSESQITLDDLRAASMALGPVAEHDDVAAPNPWIPGYCVRDRITQAAPADSVLVDTDRYASTDGHSPPVG
jgi:hypothetical protein